ncbi:unnamed protein product [Camellia sinensis]
MMKICRSGSTEEFFFFFVDEDDDDVQDVEDDEDLIRSFLFLFSCFGLQERAIWISNRAIYIHTNEDVFFTFLFISCTVSDLNFWGKNILPIAVVFGLWVVVVFVSLGIDFNWVIFFFFFFSL